MERRRKPTIIVAEEQKNELAPIVMKWAGLALRYWYWIVLSVVAALCVGFVYQQKKARVYTTQAVVLIEQKDGNSSTMRAKAGNSQINTLMQLNGISAGDNLKNEMFILSSLRLMKLVVPALHLDVDYTTKESMHDVALYRNRPFVVRFAQAAKTPGAMSVSIGTDGRFTLTDFEQMGKKYKLTEEQSKQVITARVGEEVSTPIGRVTIDKDVSFKAFDRDKKVTVTHYPADVAAEIYKSRISASELEKDCDLIVLSLADINCDRAADVLLEVVETYKKDVIDNKNSEAQRTAEFIDGRLELISRELAEVEGEYAKFKADNKIADLGATATALTQESAKARNATTELNTQLTVAKYLEEYLRSTSGVKDVIPVVSNFNNSAVAAQINDYNRLLLDRNRQASNSNEDAPWVREQDRQLEKLRAAIYSSLSSYVKSVELELRAAEASEGYLLGKTGEVPVKEQKVIDIARQQNLKEALYTYLLNKREEVALQLAIEEANVRLVEDPASSKGPVAPRTKVIMLIALLIGLVVPFVVLYIRELFDTTITSRKDVEDALSMPIVGELPHLNKSDDRTLIYGPGADLSAPIAEAFRLLRYGLHYLKPDAKVLLVTSSTPSHGKSFVSRNLASCMAMTQKRVLLMDADIRVRNLSRNQGLSSARGITEYLVGDVDDPREIIVHDCFMEGVDFLPAGTTPPNTTELLMGERLDQLLQELRADYDFILIDTTPAFAVADASIVSRVTDLTLFIIRVGEQVRAALPTIEELYQSKKCGNLCAVINDSDRKARSYGYGYTGGYSYSYQYGYGKHGRHGKKKHWWQLGGSKHKSSSKKGKKH